MTITQIENWRDYRRDGGQFLKTARAAHQKESAAFSPCTLYNLTCMGIEKLIMAYLMKNGKLAENHTMGDLLRALEEQGSQFDSLRDGLLYLDTFQEICSLEAGPMVTPAAGEISRILTIGAGIEHCLTPLLTEPQSAAATSTTRNLEQ
jgi:hypothetical protein